MGNMWVCREGATHVWKCDPGSHLPIVRVAKTWGGLDGLDWMTKHAIHWPKHVALGV